MFKIENTQSYQEITTQAAALSQTLAYMKERREDLREFFQKGDEEWVFVASGSSYWMSLSAHMTARMKTGRNAHAVKAGDVLLCPEEYVGIYRNPTFICPSRSGKTTEVLRALDILQAAYPQSRVLSIVIHEDSALEKRSDFALWIPWANEKSVCQTRSFSCLYLAAVLMAACVAADDAFFDECRRYLNHAPTIFAHNHLLIKDLVRNHPIQALICLGAGRQYGVCIEGAYIVIEMAQFDANYYNLLEYRHGPIVTAKPGTMVCMLINEEQEVYEASLAHEIQRSGATVMTIGNRALDYADFSLVLPGIFSKEIHALFYSYVMQILACEMAVKRGVDPDNPGQLVPFIQF